MSTVIAAFSRDRFARLTVSLRQWRSHLDAQKSDKSHSSSLTIVVGGAFLLRRGVLDFLRVLLFHFVEDLGEFLRLFGGLESHAESFMLRFAIGEIHR